MSLRFVACSIAALCAVAGGARADRYGRGLALFQQAQCTLCHGVGWKEPGKVGAHTSVDLTRITLMRSDGELRKWLADPYRVNPKTPCSHRALSAAQIGDLVHFLHARAQPPPIEVHPVLRHEGGAESFVRRSSPSPRDEIRRDAARSPAARNPTPAAIAPPRRVDTRRPAGGGGNR